VVVTLTAGRDRDQTERGKHLYTSPIVWHLGVVLLLSGAAVVPGIKTKLFGAVAGGLALLGIAMGLRSSIGNRARPTDRAQGQFLRYVVVRDHSDPGLCRLGRSRRVSVLRVELECKPDRPGADGALAGQHRRQ